MAPLRNIPNELLLQIVVYLLRPDLASVSRVCRRMHRIATPLLYNEASLGTGNESSIDLGLFIRTLLSPGGEALAPLMHHLHVAWSCEVMPLYHEDLPLFLAAARRSWGFSGRQLTECGQVILLLHLLPDLHSLDIFPPGESDEFTEFFDSLSSTEHTTSLPLALQSLRTFYCSYEPLCYSVLGKTLLTLLRLPHIRRITLPAPGGIYFGDADALLATTARSPITHLTFPFARIIPHELATILAAPAALTHFAFFPRSISVNFDFRGLQVALAPVRATLTVLVLHFWTSQARAAFRGGASSSVGSLRAWPVLRTVRCSLLVLLGLGLPGESREIARVLPECVVEIEILPDRVWSADEALFEAWVVVARRRVVVPQLRRLTVFARGGGESAARERLRRACVEGGVVCVDYVARRDEGGSL